MAVIQRVTWDEVRAALARVEEALGSDDANLLRAALCLRGAQDACAMCGGPGWSHPEFGACLLACSQGVGPEADSG